MNGFVRSYDIVMTPRNLFGWLLRAWQCGLQCLKISFKEISGTITKE